MLEKSKEWIVPALFLLVGLVSVALFLVLAWFDVTIPLNRRHPVVSPDGEYFAYFDRFAEGPEETAGRSDLVISTSRGGIVARYPMPPGTISWSNAGHLVVISEAKKQATLLSSAAGTFVVLTSLVTTPGTVPQWALSGTKLAFVRSGAAGPEISVYDLLQTQALQVPLAPSLHLDHPILLSWSPGGQQLYFLNHEGQQTALYKCDVNSGDAQPIVKSPIAWEELTTGLPEMSSDGRRIYLPQPFQSVVDAETGAALWVLPAKSRALWSPWSSDGSQLYYSSPGSPGDILAHDFPSQTDRMVLSATPSNGFFSADGGSYFFRLRQAPGGGDYISRLTEWLRRDRGWRHADSASRIVQPMGGRELWPRETTHRGLLQMSQDEYFRVRYGLYDPNARTFSEFRFPTEREDIRRQLDSRVIVLVAAGLYGMLGFLVFLARPRSRAARALSLLSLAMMLLFVSLDLFRSLHAVYGAGAVEPGDLKIAALGWTPLLPRAAWMDDQVLLFLVFLAGLPPLLLHFSLAFPEGNRFLASRKFWRLPLYAVALIPLVASLDLLTPHQPPAAKRALLLGAAVFAGGLAVGLAFAALIYNLQLPRDRRARDQVRWVLTALAGPLVGLFLLYTGETMLHHVPVGDWRQALGGLSTTSVSLLFLFTPLAIGYALMAHKLFDIHLLFRRTVRYTVLTGAVVVVYLALAAGLSWAIAGALGRPSPWVFIVAMVLTATILAPARTGLVRAIDRSVSREHFDYSTTLQSFAQGLPNILDRQVLTTGMSQTIRGALKAESFCLFTYDRQARKFRIEKPDHPLPSGIAEVEFDPGEPLCRYLIERGRPFEVEVSPYDAKLIPVFQSASDRLAKLQAAVIFGLVRREELVGLMVLSGKTSDEFYNSEDLELLQAVARQAAIALENTHLLEEAAGSREVGGDVDLPEAVRFLPGAIPQREGCQIAGRSIVARSVGGDYHDFLELPSDKVGLAIGCVSGKGVAASVLMTSLQGQLRGQAESAKNLPALIRRINRHLFVSFRGAKYCTFFYAVYDPAERRLEFVNAGHNPPLVLGPKGIRFLASTGVPLGLFAETDHDVRLISLEYGAVVVLYSDGVTAVRDQKGELYGVDRLMASVTRAAAMDAAAMVERILSDVRAFADHQASAEDQTVVVLRVTAV